MKSEGHRQLIQVKGMRDIINKIKIIFLSLLIKLLSLIFIWISLNKSLEPLLTAIKQLLFKIKIKKKLYPIIFMEI
jgi:hypothetical protein